MEGEREQQVMMGNERRAAGPVGEDDDGDREGVVADSKEGSPLPTEQNVGDVANSENGADAENAANSLEDGSGDAIDQVDVTYSQIASSEPPVSTPVKRKAGRPRKQAAPVTPAPTRSISALDHDESPSSVRSSARAHKPPAVFSPTDEWRPNRGSSISGKGGSGKVKVATFTSEEEMNLQAGVPGVYMNPAGSSRAENSNKKILGRPRISSIAVFKSDKLKDPDYLTNNIGSWTESLVAIQTEQLLEAEAKKQAKADAKAAAKLAASEAKPKRVYQRKPKTPAPLPSNPQDGVAAATPPPPPPPSFSSTPQPQTPQSTMLLPGGTPVFSQIYQQLYGNTLFGKPREYCSPFAKPVETPSAQPPQPTSDSATCVNSTPSVLDVERSASLQPVSTGVEESTLSADSPSDKNVGAVSSVPALDNSLPSIEAQGTEDAVPVSEKPISGVQELAQTAPAMIEPSKDPVADTTSPPEPSLSISNEVAPVKTTPVSQGILSNGTEQSNHSVSPPVEPSASSIGDGASPEVQKSVEPTTAPESEPIISSPVKAAQSETSTKLPDADNAVAESNPDEAPPTAPPRRGRGRPRKNPIAPGVTPPTAKGKASNAAVPTSARKTRSRPSMSPAPIQTVDPATSVRRASVTSASSARVTRSVASMSPVPDEAAQSRVPSRRASVASSTGSARATRSKASLSSAPNNAPISSDTQLPTVNDTSSKRRHKSNKSPVQIANDSNAALNASADSDKQAETQIEILDSTVQSTVEEPTSPDVPSGPTTELVINGSSTSTVQDGTVEKLSVPISQQSSEDTPTTILIPHETQPIFKTPHLVPQSQAIGTGGVSSYKSPYQSPYKSPYASSTPGQPNAEKIASQNVEVNPPQSTSISVSQSPNIPDNVTSQTPANPLVQSINSSNADISATIASKYTLPSFMSRNYNSIYGEPSASPTTYKSIYAATPPVVNGANADSSPAKSRGTSERGKNYPKAKRGRPKKNQLPQMPQPEVSSDSLPMTPINQQYTPNVPPQAYSASHQIPMMSMGLPDFVKPVSTQTPMNPGDFFDEEHERAVRSATPQTPMSQPRPASSQLSQPDYTPILDISKRRKSSLTVRKRNSSILPVEQPQNFNMPGDFGAPNDLSMQPVPVNSEQQQMQLEADLLAAESAEIQDFSSRLACVFDKAVGNLVLSKDKLQLRFVELHPNDLTPLSWSLSIVDFLENPTTSEAKTKRAQLVLTKKTEDGKETYKFAIASTDLAQQALANMRKELIKAKITASIQKRLRENILEQSNKVASPAEVVKRFKCDTCGGAWLNREGVKYHKEHSKTTCNPNWVPPTPSQERSRRGKKRKLEDDEVFDAEKEFMQLRQQAPLVLPNPETGAWEEVVVAESLPRRNTRKRQKRVIEDTVDFDFSDEEDTEDVQVWEQAATFLPNPLTGAWDQAPVKVKKPSRRAATKKAKKKTKQTPKPRNRAHDSDVELVVDDEDSGYEDWLARQLGARRRRRDSTSSEDEDVFLPDFEERDVALDENVSGSDAEPDEPWTSMSPAPRNSDKSWGSGRKGAGRQKASSARKERVRKQPSLFNTTPRPKTKWVDPRVKNPMTEEEKAAKRQRAVLRQQQWKQPIAFLPNSQTGAWDQQPVIPVTYSRKGCSIQRKYRLPEPITYMQAADSTWSFRPFGHGLRPIFARPGRRSDGGLTLNKHLAKLSAGPRPVIYPQRRMFGPAPPSKNMLRDVARGYESASDEQEGVNDGNTGRSLKRKRKPRRSLAQDSDVEADNENWFQVKRRRTSLQLSSGDEDIERSNVLDPININSSRRLTRGLRAKISNATPNSDESSFLKKLEPKIGRQINPGLDSLPPSFGLDISASTSDPVAVVSDDLVTDRPTTQINHDQWPEILSKDGSITLQGWWPASEWLEKNNMPTEISLEDVLNQGLSSVDSSTYIDQPSINFELSIEFISEWEQGVAKDFLFSGTSDIGTRWFNHTVKPHEPSLKQTQPEIQWLDENSFTVDTIPYGDLDSVGRGIKRGAEEELPIEPPAKRQKRSYVRKNPVAASGRAVRDTQKRYKNRTLTALQADLEGIMDSPEAAAAALGIQVVPSPIVPAPRQRGNHPDGAMSAEVETRLIVAIVVMRTLIGGLEQQIDWVLIGKVFPEFSMNFLNKTWNKLSKGKSALIDKLGRGFQEPFLKAYEADEVPPIDYDNLADYDWDNLIDWTMENVPLVVDLKPQDLPATREELEDSYELIENGEPDKRYHYYSIFMPTYKRLEIVSMYHNTNSLEVESVDDEVDESTVARSWVRASQFTPDADWDENKEYAKSKLNELGDDLVSDALEELRTKKVLIHKNRRREVPGRAYEPTIGFSESFRKLVEEKQLIQAAHFKAFLDAEFADPDGDARRDGIPVDWMADDGTVMCITNLQAHGRIVLQTSNVPMNKFGLTDGGYETRKLEKSRLRFDMQIFPTAKYQFTSDISEVHSLAKIPPPIVGDLDAIPVWCDIFQNVMEYMWRKVITGIIGHVSTRSGINLEGLKRDMSPAMEGWEIILFMKWAEEVGALKRCDEEVDGWVADEWWWLIAGIVLATEAEAELEPGPEADVGGEEAFN